MGVISVAVWTTKLKHKKGKTKARWKEGGKEGEPENNNNNKKKQASQALGLGTATNYYLTTIITSTTKKQKILSHNNKQSNNNNKKKERNVNERARERENECRGVRIRHVKLYKYVYFFFSW